MEIIGLQIFSILKHLNMKWNKFVTSLNFKLDYAE